jgi:hypothetical protein
MTAPIPSDPFGVVAVGGSFVSEEDGTTISATTPLFAAIPSFTNGQSVDLNALTEFVFIHALEDLAQNATPLDVGLPAADTLIKSIYGLSTDPEQLIPDYTLSGIGSDQGQLGLVLGALINEDQILCPSAPGGLFFALALDVSDGIFDGKVFTAPIPYCGSGNFLPATAGTALFEDALAGIYGSQHLPRAFTFGGTNNALTLNGVSPSDVVNGVESITAGISNAYPSPVNSMTPGPPMGTPTPTVTQAQDRESATATTLTNGLVLIAGGASSQIGIRDDAVLYDPVANTFTVTANTMSDRRTSATATLLPNGKVLIAGGLESTGDGIFVNTSTDLFDPSTNKFTPGPDMSTAREHAAAVLLPNGTVLIAGGDTGTAAGALKSTDIYTPAASGMGSMSAGPTMQVARTNLMATILLDGTALFAGGESAGSSTLNSAEIFTPGSGGGAFALTTNPMNGARQNGTATLLPNGNVLIAGGVTVGDSTQPLNTTELYQLATAKFQSPRTASTTKMNVARGNMVAVLTANGRVFIAGGGLSTGQPGYSSTELYIVSTDSFATSGLVTLSAARAFPTGSLLDNGEVLIAGGGTTNPSGGVVTTNTTDLYTP